MRTEVKTQTIDGISYKIEVDSQTGHFHTKISEAEHLEALSLKGLVEKLTSTMRGKLKVGIPALILDVDRWEDKPPVFVKATVTGIHGGNGNLLIQKDRGKGIKPTTEQAHFYGDNELLRDLSKEEQKQVLAAWQLKKDTQTAYKDLVDSLKLDAKAEIAKLRGEEIVK